MPIPCEYDPSLPAAWSYVLWGETHYVSLHHYHEVVTKLSQLGLLGPLLPDPFTRLWDNEPAPAPDPEPPPEDPEIERLTALVLELQDERLDLVHRIGELEMEIQQLRALVEPPNEPTGQTGA